MKIGSLTLAWFDFLLVALLAFGIFRGRKRGMSEEMLDLFQWLVIIAVGALIYDPVGRVISRAARIDLFYGYIIAYGFTAVFTKLGFAAVKRMVGEKLVQSDTFGNYEYYLGMVAGALRYFCVVLFCLSFLHAKYVSAAERAASHKMQQENFGFTLLPTMGSMQQSIFHESWTGGWIAKHLDEQLMNPAGRHPALPRQSIGRLRQRTVEDAMK